MRLLSPIKQEQCSQLMGLPVCAIMHDGTRKYGILNLAKNGKLYLNYNTTADTSGLRDNNKPLSNKKTKLNAKANLKTAVSTESTRRVNPGFPDFAPYGHSGGSKTSKREAVDLASVSVLFTLI